MKRFLNKEKNNIISTEIGGGCKLINARGPWGKRWTHGIYGFSCVVLIF